MNDSRSGLRRRLLDARDLLGREAQQEAAESIVAHVVDRVRAARSGPRIAGYLAYGGEVDLRRAMAALIDDGFDIVLPVCGPDFIVDFCPWRPGDPMTSGRYGIAEPTSDPVEITSIGTVLVPGVGFDESGSRIGHGAGYYDRFFARCFAAHHAPRRLGIAHDVQMVTLPPPEPWDVAMHEVITPTKVVNVTM